MTYDFARMIRGTGVALVSGFHSPIEKDCLETLLRGSDPIVICPARRLSASRVPTEWQKSINSGQMLLLSPFDEKQNRATARLAAERNRFVTRVADEVLIAYAHPGSKTEALCREVLASGKRVYTFNDPSNQHLIAMGAVPIEPDHFSGAATPHREIEAR
jgi:predicted Rossmann fold nucleotide-binding protein DprA/Smf involved in DNA uptake